MENLTAFTEPFIHNSVDMEKTAEVRYLNEMKRLEDELADFFADVEYLVA